MRVPPLSRTREPSGSTTSDFTPRGVETLTGCAAATRRLSARRPPMNQLPQTAPATTAAAAA